MSETQTTANPLGTDRIGKLLRGFAVPGIISMVINSLYNMVDQIFIGQGVGMLGNGATNIIAPISTFAIAVAALFGDGLATYFSLQLGKGEPEKASQAVGNSIISGEVVSALLTVLVLVFLNPLFSIFCPISSCSASFFLAFTSSFEIRFPNFTSKNWKMRQAPDWNRWRRFSMMI